MDAIITSRPIENIIYPSGLKGTYKVYVSIHKNRTRQPNGSTKYKLEVAKDGQQSRTWDGIIPNNTPKNIPKASALLTRAKAFRVSIF